MRKFTRAAAFLLSLTMLAVPVWAADDTEISDEPASNSAPVAENQELETYRGVSVGGRLKAWDADGDALTFELAVEPMKGEVAIDADGCFV